MINKASGFTLLEVMIAITVFALIATTMSQATSITVDNQIHLEQKLLACWIAENETTLLRTKAWAEIKSGKKDLEYSDRKWLVSTNVKDKKTLSGLPIPAGVKLDIREVVISVALESSPDSNLFSLTSYMAKDDEG